MPGLIKYPVTDILDGSAGEFEDTDEVYEAVGEVLLGISGKSENDIRYATFLNLISCLTTAKSFPQILSQLR